MYRFNYCDTHGHAGTGFASRKCQRVYTSKKNQEIENGARRLYNKIICSMR